MVAFTTKRGASWSNGQPAGASPPASPAILRLGWAPQRRAQRGLTFVELLIAATMISVLFVGLASHLRGGIVVWQQATQTVEAVQRRSVAWEQLSRDLANAVIYDDRDAAYGQGETPLPWPRFESGYLAFFTVQKPAPGAPASVRFVTYQCGRLEASEGNWLWRTSQSVSEARVNKRPPSPEPLLAGCQEMSVRFAYLPPSEGGTPGAGPLEWRSEWREAHKQLPWLLEVSFTGEQATRRRLTVPSGIFVPFQQVLSPS